MNFIKFSFNKKMLTNSFKRYYNTDVVVMGGGVSGASTLYHLSKKGINNTILLEKHKLTAGTTWHSAGLFWNCRPNYRDIEISLKTKELLNNLEKETQVDVGWNNNGGLFIATTNERLDEYKRMHTLCKYYNINSYILNQSEIKDLYPLMNVEDVVGGLYCKDDGTIEPDGLTRAYAKYATINGAKIKENTNIENIIIENNKVIGVKTENEIIYTNKVVNCLGVWSNELCKKNNLSIPLLPMKHAYILTDEIPNIENMPNVRDHDFATYFKLQGNKLAIGGYENNPLCWKPIDFPFSLFDLDMDVFSQHIESHIHRIPIINDIGIQSTICGPESFTPDHKPLIGESPIVEGLYFNCGHNSMGITTSGGFSSMLAELIHSGQSKNIYNYDIKRFHSSIVNNEKWIKDSSIESYAKNYHIVWPHDEHLSGRNLIKDKLHNTLLKKGCIFGSSGNFEVPLYYSNNKIEHNINEEDYINPINSDYYKELQKYYTFNWSLNFDNIRNEHLSCRNNTVLFNQSSFGKFILEGKDSHKLLDYLCTNKIKSKIGSTVYTLMCNNQGGIESDITVNKIDNDRYYIIVSGSFRQYTFDWINKHIKNNNCNLKDVTEDYGVLSIMGKDSKNILNLILKDNVELKFSTNNIFNINNIRTRIIRLSYVGELGYELHIPSNNLVELYHLIHNKGNKYNLIDAGYNAMESLSMEKGFKHWNSDITSEDTPIESNMEFLCKSKKYLGSEIINNQIKYGVKKKLICLSIDDNIPLFNNELIYRNNICVGFIRRGNFSHMLNKSIGYGYINNDNKYVDEDYIINGNYELEILNKKYKANLHMETIFDKNNDRIKGIY